MSSGLAGRALRSLALLFACLAMCTFVMAQSTTNGAIGGTVLDTNGAAVAGAKVTAHNNGTNAEKTVIADPSGNYRINELQPGTYTVSISGGSGFSPHKAEQVIVQVGSLTDISPRLKVGGATETVDVSAEAPQINTTSADFAPVINQTAIAELPVNGGRWSNFSLLTPGVVSDSNVFGLLSFRGISSLLNNNTFDGADNNQAFFSEERGRTRVGYSTPKSAVQEFQVNTSNYSAEYGRSAGGVVNTVSKSGTNAFHGEGYYYDRNTDIGAANPFTQIAVQDPSTGAFNLVNFKPTDWLKNAGFGVGGPLVKDKLFLFVAYDWYHHNFPGTAVTSNPTAFFAPPSAATISTLAGRLGVTNAQATTIYNNDLAGLNSLLGPLPRTGVQNIFFPKLDWNISSKNHASFSFNRMRWTSPGGIQTQPTVTRGNASFGNDFVKETWGVARLDSMITSNLVNELRFQYGRDFEYQTSQAPGAYEVTNLVNGGLAQPGYVNPLGLPPSVSITNGFTFGVPTFLQRPRFPDEVRQQYADTMTYTHGKHTFKYGFDFSHVDDLSQNLATQFGSYSYSSLLNYFSDFNKPNTCSGKPCYTSFSQAFGPLGFEFTTNDYAMFAQDDWKVLRRLSLSFGLRYEYEMLPKTFASLVNPAIPQTAQLPRDQNNFGPRIGFAWDALGDGKTILRGGYGIYYGRVINSTIFSALTNTAMPGGQTSASFNATQAGAPIFPTILNPSGSSVPGKTAAYFNRHFQNPQIHQMDLTLERDLGWGTVVSASYLGSLGRELPTFIDDNICASAAQSGCSGASTVPGTVTYKIVNGGPLGSLATLTEPLFRGRPNASFGTLTDIVSGVNSSYHALVAQVSHRFNHHIQFSANYTWAHAIDFGQNQQTFTGFPATLLPFNVAGEKANSQYDVPNRFVVHAVMTSPWKLSGFAKWFANDWTFSPVYQIQNGLPFTLGTSGSAPGGASGGINGSGGAFRVDAIGANTFRMPTLWLANARLTKGFSIGEKVKLDLMTDFFNIFNKQNVMGVNQTGYSVATSNVNTPTGTVVCSAAAPCLNFNVNSTSFAPLFNTVTSVNNSNFLYRPREFQLGARIKF